MGLSYQIPPSKLSTMSNGEGIQRLFLERSTEALPMGSKIRNAVGSNFEEALHLLQMEIEKRMGENGSSVESSTGAKRNNKKTSKSPHKKYSLLAFSRDSLHSISSCNKKLKLCSDFASSSDFLLGTTDVLRSYKHALLYNRRDIDTTLSIDHGAFIYAFIEQLPDDGLVDMTTLESALKSIREFV